MPKRQNIITFDSTEVQGEGSWTKVRLVSHGESKRIAKEFGGVAGKSVTDMAPGEMEAIYEVNESMVIQNVIEWNWVDEDGDPLPLPQDQPAIVDQMTEAEIQFLTKAIRGEGDRKK